MSVRRYALGASLAAFALTAAVPSAHALSTWDGTFDISVYTYDAGGAGSSGVLADPTKNTFIVPGNLLGTIQYNGQINFNQLGPVPGGGAVGTFLQSGGGSLVTSTYYNAGLSTGGTSLWDSTNPLSQPINPITCPGCYGQTTAWVITAPGGITTTSGTGTIFSDDGAELWQGGVKLGGLQGPQSVTPSTYAGLTNGAILLFYVETNGLPADLVIQSDGTALGDAPLPAALPLFASGLGALGLLGWRRKRKSAPAIAA